MASSRLLAIALRLGDVIDLEFHDGYDICTVIEITKKGEGKDQTVDVKLFRPYVIVSDHRTNFEGTCKLTPYIGAETFTIYGDGKMRRTYKVIGHNL